MKTFKELIEESAERVGFSEEQKEEVLDLLKTVRSYTVKECMQAAQNSAYVSIGDGSAKVNLAPFLMLDVLSVNDSL